LRHAEYKVHLIVFAPAHQFIAAEAGIPAQNDFHFRPRCPDLRHDPFYFRQATEGRIVIGFSQTRAQNVFAAENIERQIAIVVVVAVEEPSFLLPM
jgi:hypothetical protein